jgi:hypothetical protein
VIDPQPNLLPSILIFLKYRNKYLSLLNNCSFIYAESTWAIEVSEGACLNSIKGVPASKPASIGGLQRLLAIFRAFDLSLKLHPASIRVRPVEDGLWKKHGFTEEQIFSDISQAEAQLAHIKKTKPGKEDQPDPCA